MDPLPFLFQDKLTSLTFCHYLTTSLRYCHYDYSNDSASFQLG